MLLPIVRTQFVALQRDVGPVSTCSADCIRSARCVPFNDHHTNSGEGNRTNLGIHRYILVVGARHVGTEKLATDCNFQGSTKML